MTDSKIKYIRSIKNVIDKHGVAGEDRDNLFQCIGHLIVEVGQADPVAALEIEEEIIKGKEMKTQCL